MSNTLTTWKAQSLNLIYTNSLHGRSCNPRDEKPYIQYCHTRPVFGVMEGGADWFSGGGDHRDLITFIEPSIESSTNPKTNLLSGVKKLEQRLMSYTIPKFLC